MRCLCDKSSARTQENTTNTLQTSIWVLFLWLFGLCLHVLCVRKTGASLADALLGFSLDIVGVVAEYVMCSNNGVSLLWPVLCLFVCVSHLMHVCRVCMGLNKINEGNNVFGQQPRCCEE